MENESGAFDQDRYENEKVCVYCGKPMIESYISCCGEVHFMTQQEIDNVEGVENV